MQALKSIGSTLLGIVIFVGSVIALILLFTLGSNVAFTIQPFVNWLSGILFGINLFTLLVALVPKARGVAGIILYLSSYIYGLSTWIFGLAVSLSLWGWIWVIAGILLGGVGVVPIGMLAAIINGQWGVFWSLFFSLALTYIVRVVGALLVSNYESQQYDDVGSGEDVIDIKPEPHNRTWEDVE